MENSNYLSEFINFLSIERNLSLNSIESYKNDISRFISFLGKKKVVKAGQEDISGLFRLLHDLGLVDTTIARNFSSLKTFYKFFIR